MLVFLRNYSCTMNLFDLPSFIRGPKFYEWKRRYREIILNNISCFLGAAVCSIVYVEKWTRSLLLQCVFKGPSRSWSYCSWIYNFLCNKCLSPLMLLVRISIMARCTALCDKVCQWLATGRWFSFGPLVSSTNKTDRHDITEILLMKVALNTIKQTNNRSILLRYNKLSEFSKVIIA